MQNKKFRAFFAVDLPENLKRETEHFIALLRQPEANKNIVWTKTENLHITLKFLGNISQQQCEQILPAVKAAISKCPKFKLKLTKLMFFPSERMPKIIALFPSPLDKLVTLACKIEEQVINYDIKAEARAFKPHLTLARIKRQGAYKAKDIILPQLGFEVQAITLFRSETSHEGSCYTPLEKIEL